MFRATAIVLSLIGMPTVSAAEEDISAIASFGDWSVFNDGGDCWVASYAKDAFSNDVEEIMVFVTFHQHDTVPDITLWFETGNMRATEVVIELDGKAYSLVTDDDTTFSSPSQNSALLDLMLAEEPATVAMTGVTGPTEVHVGYKGFREAYLGASKTCTFAHNNDVDGDPLTEPT